MVQNAKETKNAKNINDFFLQNRKKTEMEIFAFCTIAFEPIEIWTCYAHQNDRLNLSFVKVTSMVGQKMARNGCKTSIYESVLN